jgi:hypothetical protein
MDAHTINEAIHALDEGIPLTQDEMQVLLAYLLRRVREQSRILQALGADIDNLAAWF